MIHLMEVDEVLNIIRQEIKSEISLREGLYYKYESGHSTVILRSENTIDQGSNILDVLISLGVPLFQLKKSKIEFFPSIMDYITGNFGLIQANTHQLQNITFGHTVPIHAEDGYYFIIDDFKRKVAFGILVNNIFQSFVDIGWYIRIGQ